METSRFVRPETKTLTLGNGDTLLVKKRLNHGEQRAAFARLCLAGADGTVRVNPLSTGMAQVTAYLLDWSLKDNDGRQVKIQGVSVDDLTAALDNLSPEDFAEIRAAIEDHEAAMAAERAQEKNERDGVPNEPAISPSPSAVAGASSGSVN